MRKKYIAGIDIGTTGAKTILFDLAGEVVGTGYREYGCRYPHPTWVEQDADELIGATFGASRDAIAQSGIDPRDILSVAASTQRACCLFIDKDDRPLLMMSWQDSRTTQEVALISRVLGDVVFYDITGMPNKPAWMVSKILYVREKEKEIWEKTRKHVQLQDYLLRRLGADDYYSDESEAALTGLWDIDRFRWSDRIIDALGIDRRMLSNVLPSGTKVGAISREAAEKSGFAEGTPLCTGLGDQNSATIGAGVVQPGMLSVSLGTGGEAVAFLDRRFRDMKGYTGVCNHGMHGYWQMEGLQNGSAGVFRWFRDEIAATEKARALDGGRDPYELMTAMAQRVPAGANGLLCIPHMAAAAAPRWNTKARGIFLGMTLAHSRAHLVRACMEGIILEQKDILNSFAKLGFLFERVRIIGGPTKSELWNQIQADIYNLPTETVKVKDAAVLGGAMAGAVGIGLYKDLKEAAFQLVKLDKRYEPNPQNVSLYEELFGIYCTAYEQLERGGVYDRISALQS